ncbi:related to putative protein [Rhynchosporium agropyri]|uniref:Uncharacterized protein n=1 Tax=Rhynchosporium agropyri TaxID=914238 RepID=A0A1E1LN84_9HELO|nr:related to putative protein [Rhynchosporium agropyri]
MKLLTTLLVLGASLHNVNADEYIPPSKTIMYFLRWNTNAQFQKFDAVMTAPPIKNSGDVYLWPGLQDVDQTGVFQEVLQGIYGGTGKWWMQTMWCCSNSQRGDGIDVLPGNKIAISNTLSGDRVNWLTNVTVGSISNNEPFALGYKAMNQAILCIEVQQGAAWDFGPLTWENVVMVVNTTDHAFCLIEPENWNDLTIYSMTKPKAVTKDGLTTCTIDKIVMERPA